jgi:hypothetical protein
MPGGRSGGGRVGSGGSSFRRQNVSNSLRDTPFVDTHYHSDMVPERIAEYRVKYRASEIGPRYSGIAHFAFTSTVCLSILTAALWNIHPRAWEIALVPIFFVIANMGEYFGHRGPMHHPTRGLGLIYRRHTLQHHHFFTNEAMSYESWRDVKMVLFPPYLIVFFFGGMALPIGAALWAFTTANVARLFVAVAIGYFLTYEWLHFSYHLNPESWIGRRKIIQLLRRHHTIHHDLEKMTAYNFNITFPICDALFGTSFRR